MEILERAGEFAYLLSFDFEMDSRPSKTKHSRKIETVEPAVEVEMTCRPSKMLLLFATTRSGRQASRN